MKENPKNAVFIAFVFLNEKLIYAMETIRRCIEMTLEELTNFTISMSYGFFGFLQRFRDKVFYYFFFFIS